MKVYKDDIYLLRHHPSNLSAILLRVEHHLVQPGHGDKWLGQTLRLRWQHLSCAERRHRGHHHQHPVRPRVPHQHQPQEHLHLRTKRNVNLQCRYDITNKIHWIILTGWFWWTSGVSLWRWQVQTDWNHKLWIRVWMWDWISRGIHQSCLIPRVDWDSHWNSDWIISNK